MTVVSSKDGKPVMIDHHTPFTVLSLARLKGVDRMVEKAENEHKGDFSRIVDVVRCSVVVFTEEQLESVAQALKQRLVDVNNEEEEKQQQPEIVVVRLKNRFKEPLFNGYRDALYNIEVYCNKNDNHVDDDDNDDDKLCHP